MNTIENLNKEIASIEAQIQPLARRLDALRSQKRDQESRAYIAANNIKREDVETPDGAEKPWFGTVMEFARWMRTHGMKKPWAAWNGRIYRTSDLVLNRMPDSPAMVDHLPA
jgi:chromosome segregation ATPase